MWVKADSESTPTAVRVASASAISGEQTFGIGVEPCLRKWLCRSLKIQPSLAPFARIPHREESVHQEHEEGGEGVLEWSNYVYGRRNGIINVVKENKDGQGIVTIRCVLSHHRLLWLFLHLASKPMFLIGGNHEKNNFSIGVQIHDKNSNDWFTPIVLGTGPKPSKGYSAFVLEQGRILVIKKGSPRNDSI
ncbi:hypothetical protein ISN44_As09g011430 [Arabidopsis suecica]|uniref:Uncharacterized protein n=1 Tax=Arabidopsis suecica TaxID=45249 RepID=A0A8T2AH14_ARASU|nr:hypothetical protein ISN44_As09g011430 [Arabidopsis suecica]